MKRIGYDSDSGRYYFRDTDGTYWRGSPGEEFGEMTKGELKCCRVSALQRSLRWVLGSGRRAGVDVVRE
jgi:hypothetical protein